MYIPYGFDGKGENPTKSCSISVNVDNPETPFISIVLGDGAAVQIQGGEVTLRGAGGTSHVTIGRDATQIVGELRVTGGVSLGSEAAMPLVLYEAFAAWAMALEAKISASVVGPPAVPFASLSALMKTKFTKAA
ncbi:hypothetical protein LZC95_19935 [Pendulispora brunnea]|uniref:Uncharacterized protein n=1 Tax=Pendulispora brunnea TaxID=2905690 RepID=A0ABZ2KPU3_9BACT